MTSSPPPSGLVQQALAVAARYKIPPQLFLRQVAAESSWNPNAHSPAGALGLMQLMPGTASGLGVRNPFDPSQSLEGGARYLREQFNTFHSWPLALAAYNAGPGAVQKFGGIPPYQETQHYVQEIMGGAPVNIPAGRAGVSTKAAPPLGVPPQGPGLAPGLSAVQARVVADLLGMPELAGVFTGTPGLGPAPKPAAAPNIQPTPLPAAKTARAAAPAQTSYPAMRIGQPIPVKGLTVAPQADWQHVDSRLIDGLSTIARKLGVTVEIISGYRSPGYSAAVGGYSSDPHTRGVAVDAFINGVPIGDYPGAKSLLAHLGLESGAQPGFYRGKPDPEHVQIPGSGVNKSIRARTYYR